MDTSAPWRWNAASRPPPWYVIPADRKWYLNWAVAQLLWEHLAEIAPQLPAEVFDLAERRRLTEPGDGTGTH